ncbi:hypothetical protein J4G43_015370 [Bradyrhizobium barranii subsp. barranii]|uniref:Uncharacterized protein n=1 Tax=Bradyrhizobium barranii subsp. barranii TaxID=2823807 RepID=A0A939M4T3_9BRAD|nr:hypothetical protein [Bradyrhizobium barranii]UEM15458.1 hypothetical protein J4G43_015370 [Bradyrhizobium barranii subsp. barranii]
MATKSLNWRLPDTRSAHRRFSNYVVFFADHKGRKDFYPLKKLILAENLYFKLAYGSVAGEKFFDVDQNLVAIQWVQLLGVDTDDPTIVRKAIEDGTAYQLYCSIPGAGNEIFVDNLFRTLN